VKVITEVFSVIKLTTNVKKTFAKRIVWDRRCFLRGFNRTSSQLKKFGRPEVLVDFF